MLELTSDKIQHQSWNNQKEILSLKYKKRANSVRAGFIRKETNIWRKQWSPKLMKLNSFLVHWLYIAEVFSGLTTEYG